MAERMEFGRLPTQKKKDKKVEMIGRNRMNKERELYESRTKKSKALWERASKVLPMGAASNARMYDPYPIFIDEGAMGHVLDVDGNDYIDHNLCFGSLLVGHRHPWVLEAVQEQMGRGTAYGMCHDLEALVAEEILKRYSFLEKVRFANSGTEAVMHAIHLARAYTDRLYIVKMEGAYHGLYDPVMASVKPTEKTWGSAASPSYVPFGAGISEQRVYVAQYNDLRSLQLKLDKSFPMQPAAVIIEPVMLNMGVLCPEQNYLQGVRELCTKYSTLLIFDEVKSGGLGYGGAAEEYGVKPDIVCLSKSIGGGFPLAAFGASSEIMEVIERRDLFHAGTYNGNPVSLAAALVTLRDILTKEAYDYARALNKKLAEGYKKLLDAQGIQAVVETAGVYGAVSFGVEKLVNYRDWFTMDMSTWGTYWLGMVNRGVIPQPYGGDEEWTVSVIHTEADIQKHLAVLEEVVPILHVKAEAADVG